jgi:hypothetical protein
MRVTNGIPLGSSLLLPVNTVTCVQTLKVARYESAELAAAVASPPNQSSASASSANPNPNPNLNPNLNTVGAVGAVGAGIEAKERKTLEVVHALERELGPLRDRLLHCEATLRTVRVFRQELTLSDDIGHTHVRFKRTCV